VETQNLINLIFAGAASVLGWFARELWSAVKELKADIAQLPKHYVQREDYREDMREIKTMLAKIFDKLDGKQDK
tara:strand:- start:386 stop:607 length:222 start_codon:yes stop_codon:yes gene_type:complete